MVHRRLLVRLSIAIALSGCSGSTDAVNPNPPPAVTVASVRVSGEPGDSVLLVGETVTLRATVIGPNGGQINGKTVSWRSSVSDVATVSAPGAVTAVAAGSTVITATVDGVHGSVPLGVHVPVRAPAPGSTDTVTTSVLNGAVAVSVPTGAVSGALSQLSVGPARTVPDDDRFVAGTAFDFGPSGIQFGIPVTIALRYDAATVPEADRSQLRIFRIEPSGAREIPDGSSRTDAPVVSARISSFSRYAIFRRAAPTQLVIAAGDSQTAQAGTPVGVQPTVVVRDAKGRPVSRVSITFNTGPAGGRVGGDRTALSEITGRASLSGPWFLGTKAGQYTLTASLTDNPTLTTTFSARATPPPPPIIEVAPSTVTFFGTAGAANPSDQVVRVSNARGDEYAMTGVRVQSITYGSGANGWLSAAVAESDAPTTVRLRANSQSLGAGSYTATVTIAVADSGVTAVTLPVTLRITARTAASLSVTRQPAGAVSGSAFTTQPQVEIRDAAGVRLETSTASVTASIASGNGSLAGTTTVAAANGVVTFTNLRITGTGAHTLSFTAAGLTGATSSSFTVGAPAPNTITANSSLSQAATVGTAVAAPPSVRVTDANGSGVAGVSVTFAVASGGGSIAPTSAVTTNASGVASVTSWTLGSTAGTNTVTATSSGLTGSPVTFTATGTAAPSTPSRLAITRQPSGAVTGAAFTTQPIVVIQDASGNTVTNSTLTVTATKASGSGTLSGATSVAAVNGIATFNNLTITGTGPHTLSFSASGVTPVTSASFTLGDGIGAPTRLVLTTQAAGAVSGSAFTTQPVVAVRDANGNTVTSSSAVVTMTVSTGATTVGSATVNAVNGVATFNNVGLSGSSGTYTLTFASTGLTSATQSVSLSGAPSGGIVLNVGETATAMAKVGTDVVIPFSVDMTNRNGADIASITVTVSWDPAKLSYVGSSAGNWVDTNGDQAVVVVNTGGAATGTLGITGFTTEATTASFTLRNLTLKPLAAGTASVSAVVSAAGNAAGQSILVTPRNLSLTVFP